MRKFKHWLKIKSSNSDITYRQYAEIQSYLDCYPESKATLYLMETNLWDRIVLLECEQNYDDLDMEVDSGYHPLQRLRHKPAGLEKPQPFAIPKYLLKTQNRPKGEC